MKEGLRLLIVLFEEVVDRGAAGSRRDGERKTPRLSLRLHEGCEEALDGVEPGSRCRGEMERPSPDGVRAIGEHWDAYGRRNCSTMAWIIFPTGTCFSMTWSGE